MEVLAPAERLVLLLVKVLLVRPGRTLRKMATAIILLVLRSVTTCGVTRGP
jgi:hypothetical protein